MEEFHDARSRRLSILSSGSSACEWRLPAKTGGGGLHASCSSARSVLQSHAAAACAEGRAVHPFNLTRPAAAPHFAACCADLSVGEEDSEFYTPKASDLQQHQGAPARGLQWAPMRSHGCTGRAASGAGCGCGASAALRRIASPLTAPAPLQLPHSTAVGASGFSFQSDRPLLSAGSAAPSPQGKPAAVEGVAAAPPPPSQQAAQAQAGGSAGRYSDQYSPEGALGAAAGRRGGRPQLAVVLPAGSSVSGGEPQSSSEGGPEVSLNGGIASQVRPAGREQRATMRLGCPTHALPCQLSVLLRLLPPAPPAGGGHRRVRHAGQREQGAGARRRGGAGAHAADPHPRCG